MSTGDLTFSLFGIHPGSQIQIGRGVEVMGFLIRGSSGGRINVSSLRTLTGDCTQEREAAKTSSSSSPVVFSLSLLHVTQ